MTDGTHDNTTPCSLPRDFDSMRARFASAAESFSERLRRAYPQAAKEWRAAIPVEGAPELATDLCLWGRAGSARQKRHILLVSSGVHGVEGYAGSALQSALLEALDPRALLGDLDLVFVHAVNPWGMSAKDRTDEHNVDFNRNCHTHAEGYEQKNPLLPKLTPLLCPNHPVMDPRPLKRLFFLRTLLSHALTAGVSRVTRAILNGQYEDARGLFYGGKSLSPHLDKLLQTLTEWACLQDRSLEEHPHEGKLWESCTVVDLHTGLGPKGQLTLMLPSETLERMPRLETWTSGFRVHAEPRAWPVKPGIFSEWICHHLASGPPEHQLPIVFEIGTLGRGGLFATLESLERMVRHNQLKNHGAYRDNPRTSESVRQAFEELFYPSDENWQKTLLTERHSDLETLIQRCFEIRATAPDAPLLHHGS